MLSPLAEWTMAIRIPQVSSSKKVWKQVEYNVPRITNQIISHVTIDMGTYHTARHVIAIIQLEVEFWVSSEINGPMK